MKQFLLTIVSAIALTCGVDAQDSLSLNVYQKVKQVRLENHLRELQVDESLELASAQHGCWLAIYNVLIDTNQILLNTQENNITSMLKIFDYPQDRIKYFTNRNFSKCEEHSKYYYHQPTSSDVYSFIEDKVVNDDFKNQGFWVIQFETLQKRPIWYIVYLLTD